MRISFNWLKEYINTDLSAEEVGEILTQTGLEVEGLEKIETIKGGLKGIVVGRVLEKEKHPNADRLNLTRVDIGSDEPLKIVCGASNLEVDQKVLIATVGSTLHPTEGESFSIKKGKIRGEESHGMICAEDEIGLGLGHDGIMVLKEEAQIGQDAAEYFNIEEDIQIEIGLTPNRTDGMSHTGVARDLVAALKNMKGIKNDPNASMDWPSEAEPQIKNSDLSLDVKIENSNDCLRYCGISLKNVQIGESPDWLKNRLLAIGLTPINNVVDITNFVLHELGQPLHAFDIDQIEGNQIIVKNLKEGTKFTGLDSTEFELSKEDMMICNAHSSDNKAGMCIAGVFGGIDSGVSHNTNKVFLESAYFNPVAVRKTSKRHGLNTDASFRFERGVDPNMTRKALIRAASLIVDICKAEIASEIIDWYPTPIENKKIKLSIEMIDRLIGVEIPIEEIQQILTDLDISNELNGTAREGYLDLNIPAYRADVTREADVIEEILRIYGYNSIPIPEKINSSLSYVVKPDFEGLQNKVSTRLCSRGFTEMMSNSLSKEDYLEKYNGEVIQKDLAVKLLNPLSRDLNVMRQSLIFGALESIKKNQNFKNSDLSLFEFGKEYRLKDGKYKENRKLALFITGQKEGENWDSQNKENGFFELKTEVEMLLKKMNVFNNPVHSDIDHDLFEDGVSLLIQNQKIVQLGEIKMKICKDFGIKNKIWCAYFDWDQLVKIQNRSQTKFKALMKFPSSRRDLSLLIDKDTKFDQIKKVAKKVEKKLLVDVGLFDVYEDDNLGENKKSYSVNFVFQDEEKTLTDKVIDKIMGKIQHSLEKELGAQLR